MKKGLKFDDFEVTKESPFYPSSGELFSVWKIRLYHIRRKLVEGEMVVSGDDEAYSVEVRGGGLVEAIDKGEFVKLFGGGVDLMRGMSSSGVRMFGYVVSCLKKDSDVVYLPWSGYREWSGVKSATTYYRGLVEMLDSGVLARSVRKDDYFVNPMVVFNGRRQDIEAIREMIKCMK